MVVKFIPISMIDPPFPILRRFSENDVSFLELVDQIKQHNGSLQAPPARPRDGRYQIVDGYRRLKASVKAGLTEIPLRIVELNDTEYLAAQIACNSQHKDTDWVDFAAHLEKLRQLHNEEMTIAEMANLCGKATSWVRKILRLNHLAPEIKTAVQRGEVTVGNAYWLARLPRSEQPIHVTDAMTMPTRQFTKQIQRSLNEYRERIKQGKLSQYGIDKFRPIMRDLRVIEAEMNDPTHLPVLIAGKQISNPMEAAVLALNWAFRMDDKSIEERKEKLLNVERQRLNNNARRQHSRRKS